MKTETLHSAAVRASDDPAQHDHDLICKECGERLCTIEDGDTLAILASVVGDHNCGARRRRLRYELTKVPAAPPDPLEVLRICRTQLRDLNMDWPHDELCEPISTTIDRINALVGVGD